MLMAIQWKIRSVSTLGLPLTGGLLHSVAKLLVPVVPKVLPLAKSRLKRLSLICKGNLSPCLLALGEMPLDDLNEDVIFVIGYTTNVSATTSSGF